MSHLYNRILDELEYNARNSDVVNIWNQFADNNSYEHIYSMSEFDEIVGTDRSYNDVKDSLDDDFDTNKDYFYVDSGTGYYTSTDDPFDVIDTELLANEIKNDMGLYGGLRCDEIDSLFDGYAFETEMKEIVEKLSDKEIAFISNVFQEYYENDNVVERDDIVDLLHECLENEDHVVIYRMPKAIQSKYFEFTDPDFSYLSENIGIEGPVPAEEALELAGFVNMYENNQYSFRSNRTKVEKFEIKIHDDVIKSAKHAENIKSMGR